MTAPSHMPVVPTPITISSASWKYLTAWLLANIFEKYFLRARGGGRAPAAQRPPVPVQRESARQVPLTRGRAARPQGDRGPGPALAIASLLQLTSTDPGHRQPAEYKNLIIIKLLSNCVITYHIAAQQQTGARYFESPAACGDQLRVT